MTDPVPKKKADHAEKKETAAEREESAASEREFGVAFTLLEFQLILAEVSNHGGGPGSWGYPVLEH